MLFRYLARYWIASRKSYATRPWMASVVRSLRVMRWPGRHRALCKLDIYRRYLADEHEADLFHHLSHRDYLSRHLAPAERVACVLDHYRFESAAFTDDYKDRVYRYPGLRLWHHAADGYEFSIWLRSSQRYLGEGDLNLVLALGNEPLHRMGFSWVRGSIAGLCPSITPFIARNQGRWRDEHSEALLAAFESVFPHNSPAYFCAAGMQGLALAVGASQLLCVRSDLAPCSDPATGQAYPGAYDSFWNAFGGTRKGANCHVIPVPFQFRDIHELASKHRKRAMNRRAWWAAISDAACTSLLSCLVVSAPAISEATSFT